jgi:hypothetical protein
MDKLDRSESLVGLGVLFLAGGWALEKMRRRFVAKTRNASDKNKTRNASDKNKTRNASDKNKTRNASHQSDDRGAS